MFTSEEVELCVQLVRDSTLGHSVHERLEAVTDTLLVLVPGTSLSAVVMDSGLAAKPPEAHLYARNLSQDTVALYAEHYIQHDPMNVVYREASGRPSRLSDFCGSQGFGRDAFTGEFLPRMQLRHVIGCVHRLPGERVLGLAIHRDPILGDFTDHERQILEIVSPEIARACSGALVSEEIARRAVAARAGSTGARSGAILFDHGGEVVHVDPIAIGLMERATGIRPSLGDELAALVRVAATSAPEGEILIRDLIVGPETALRVRVSTLGNGTSRQVLAVLELLEKGSREHFDALCSRAGLTPKEREVASLAIRGFGNREIARELRISPVTVKVHLGRVYTKTGAPTRTELAALLLGGEVATRTRRGLELAAGAGDDVPL